MRNGPYELVVAPEAYPGFRYRGRYVYEHHLVWWNNTGELVPPGFVLHHKNENKRDNRFKNLEQKPRGLHTKEHVKPSALAPLTCARCGASFEISLRFVKMRLKRGQKRFFCCRSHQVQQQHADRKGC